MKSSPSKGFWKSFFLGASGKWFLMATIVGIVSGCGAIAFQVAGQVVVRYVLLEYSGFAPGEGHGEHALFESPETQFSFPMLLGVLTLGGLASGILVYTFAPEAEGHGTDGAIDAFHNRRGNIPLRVAIVKTIASAITLGTAGSGGREGPIAQIGASISSYLGQRMHLSARDRRILLAAGMGAGVGAIFRAPLAGALFAGEILYREADIESDVIVPAAIASIIAYSVYGLFLPPELCFAHIFGGLAQYSTHSLTELIPYSILAIALSLVAVLYIKIFYGIHELFGKLPGPKHIRPAIGALLAGLVAAGLYYSMGQDRAVLAVLSTGYGTLQQGLETPGEVGLKVLLIVGFFKILTTSLTIGSGGSGGVFGPSMVIGGCTGVAVGKICAMAWPGLVNPGAFGVVGMAGFFAGCAHAPISTIIMVSEMTGSYSLLLPAMWVSTLCFLMCKRSSLYRKQVASRLESPAHRGDFLVDVLEGITVEDVYRKDRKYECVPESMTLAEIVQLLSKTHQHYFPVINSEGSMVGIFSDDDIRRFIFDETIWQLADAADIMITRFLRVTPEEDLNSALQKFTRLNVDELPVLDAETGTKLLGMLRRKETIGAYNRRILEQKQEVAKQAE
ncbi:MAG: chloride channel protein [Planctomycetaceae bacterium]|nr:chloride channel protein [Planctomycetaceae bacterium]